MQERPDSQYDREDHLFLLLSLLISGLTGLAIVALVSITETFGERLHHASSWYHFLVPIVGSGVVGLLLYYFFPGARGSGIPQTRVAVALHNGFIPIRTVIGKFICSSISLSSGINLGREGPSVQIGGGIASAIGNAVGLSEHRVRSLVPVGTAAAVAAAFNTPLAAVLFTLEEILADLNARVVGAVVIGAATSWMVLHLFLGDQPIFVVPSYRLVHPIEFAFYLVLGLVGGCVSAGFVATLIRVRGWFAKVPQRFKPYSPMAGGLAVGALALYSPSALGIGYDHVSEAINGHLGLTAILMLLALKLVGVSACYGSGNVGGVFGPSLFIGAMTGGIIGHVAHYLLPELTATPGAYALVGMGAAFAGIIRSPMTSVIMIFEITRDYTIIVPLMVANLCSYAIARHFHPQTLYEINMVADGIHLPSPEHRPEPLQVSSAMRNDKIESTANSVHPDDSLDTALQIMGRLSTDTLPVTSRINHTPLGTVVRADVIAAYQNARPKPPISTTDAKNWIPAMCATAIGLLLMAVSLVYWQRNNVVARAADFYKLGEAHLAQSRTDEAIQEFRTALASDPKSNSARASLGFALFQAGRFTDARKYLLDASANNPSNGPILAALAHIEYRLGDHASAIASMRHALDVPWPTTQSATRIQTEIDFARMLYKEARKSEASLLLISLIERSGDDAVTGKRAAAIIEQSDSLARASEAYSLLQQHFPADASVTFDLGRVYLDSGQDAKALIAFRKAIQLDPNNPDYRAQARTAIAILHLNPFLPNLSSQQRGRRWAGIDAAVSQAAAQCLPTTDLPSATKATAANKLSESDIHRSHAIDTWHALPISCGLHPILTQILNRSL